eukprot:SM000030S11372  [mRNA]  locus=s30:299373:301989:- [translate_table: standard]
MPFRAGPAPARQQPSLGKPLQAMCGTGMPSQAAPCLPPRELPPCSVRRCGAKGRPQCRPTRLPPPARRDGQWQRMRPPMALQQRLSSSLDEDLLPGKVAASSPRLGSAGRRSLACQPPGSTLACCESGAGRGMVYVATFATLSTPSLWHASLAWKRSPAPWQPERAYLMGTIRAASGTLLDRPIMGGRQRVMDAANRLAWAAMAKWFVALSALIGGHGLSLPRARPRPWSHAAVLPTAMVLAWKAAVLSLAAFPRPGLAITDPGAASDEAYP